MKVLSIVGAKLVVLVIGSRVQCTLRVVVSVVLLTLVARTLLVACRPKIWATFVVLSNVKLVVVGRVVTQILLLCSV